MPVSSALLVLTVVVAVAVIAGIVWRARDGHRRAGSGTIDAAGLAELGVRAGRVTLVQFSTETCTRCPQVRRMLQAVASAHTAVDHVDVDLTHRADLARRHHVLSTPTTFVVDSGDTVVARFIGTPRRVDVETVLAELPALQEAS